MNISNDIKKLKYKEYKNINVQKDQYNVNVVKYYGVVKNTDPTFFFFLKFQRNYFSLT